MVTNNPDKEISPQSYAEIMKETVHRAKFRAESIRNSGHGGMFNLISAPEDKVEEQHLIEKLSEGLGIEKTDIIHINIENVVNTIELGLGELKLAIPNQALDQQSLAENVFQYVYRFFGKDRKGWRIGTAALLDHLIDALKSHQTDLAGTPFAQFLSTLDLELEISDQSPRLFVLHYPALEVDQPIQKREDAKFSNLNPEQAERVEKYLHIYSLISQVYPGKFQKDNPQGHVVVNVTDNSYLWFAAANSQWYEAFLRMSEDEISTPAVLRRDQQILQKS